MMLEKLVQYLKRNKFSIHFALIELLQCFSPLTRRTFAPEIN